MKAICIIISVLVVAVVFCVWMKFRRWTITFDDSCVTEDPEKPQITQTTQKSNLPPRDSRGRFVKQK